MLALLPAFPCAELIFRQRIKEVVRDCNLAFEGSGAAFSGRLTGHKSCHGLASTSDQDILACFDLSQKPGKLSLGLMDINNKHDC